MELVLKNVSLRSNGLSEEDKKFLIVLEYLTLKRATKARMAILHTEMLDDLRPVLPDCDHVISELTAGKLIATVDGQTFCTPLGMYASARPGQLAYLIESNRNRPYKIDTNVPNRSVMVINPS